MIKTLYFSPKKTVFSVEKPWVLVFNFNILILIQYVIETHPPSIILPVPKRLFLPTFIGYVKRCKKSTNLGKRDMRERGKVAFQMVPDEVQGNVYTPESY